MLKWFLIVTLGHCSNGQPFCDPMPGSGISIVLDHIEVAMPSQEVCEQIRKLQQGTVECWAALTPNRK